MAYKLAEALAAAAGADPQQAEEDLDLVALATVCDVVPLVGENRRLVREGVQAIARTRKPGLRALMKVASSTRARSTRAGSGSASARASTRPGGCGAPTPRSSSS